jgi:hypothetical protein
MQYFDISLHQKSQEHEKNYNIIRSNYGGSPGCF